MDFEPDPGDGSGMYVENGKIRNCYFANNCPGVLFALGNINVAPAPASIEFKHCFISDGVAFNPVKDNGIKGTVSFDDCTISNRQYDGILVDGKSATSTYLAKFSNCLLQECNPAIKFRWPYAPALGNLQFVNSTINEPDQQLTIMRDYSRGAYTLANITGNLKINSPYGVSSASLGTGTNVTLQFTEQKSKPPIVTAVKPDKGTKPEKVNNYNAGDAISISAVAWDPDNGTTSGAGISKVDFALWRGDSVRASFSDMSAPYAWPITTSTKCPRGIYLIRITAYSTDGSYTVACVPIYIYNTMDGTGPYINGPGIEINNETYNIIPEKDFLVRNTAQGFMVYFPFSTDSRIIISDLSGRQVTLAQTAKGRSWNNISTQNKLSNNVYFVQTINDKGNSNIVKKAMIAR
jgi:hypothetical protein